MSAGTAKAQGVKLISTGSTEILCSVSVSVKILEEVERARRWALAAGPVRAAMLRTTMSVMRNVYIGLMFASALVASSPSAAQQQRPPNILFIMGDDVGWFNTGAYHRGMMSGRTPNLDRLAAQGMMCTDYYAEASCTAGRANFITGQLPIRTGLTTVGQAGADVGIPDQAVTVATVLKSLGYETAQLVRTILVT